MSSGYECYTHTDIDSPTEEYLSAHYELLREDAVRPLREAVQQVRITPQAKEDAFQGSIGIYEKVVVLQPPKRSTLTCFTRYTSVRSNARRVASLSE